MWKTIEALVALCWVLECFLHFLSSLHTCLSVLLCLFFTSTFNIDPAFFDWSLFFCLSAFVCLFLKVSHFFCISLVRLQSIYPILSFILSFSSSFVIFQYFLLQSCVKAKSFIIFLFFILLFFCSSFILIILFYFIRLSPSVLLVSLLYCISYSLSVFSYQFCPILNLLYRSVFWAIFCIVLQFSFQFLLSVSGCSRILRVSFI